MKICVYGLGRFGRCVVKRLNDSAASERASERFPFFVYLLY